MYIHIHIYIYIYIYIYMTVSRLFLCAKRSLRQELLTARRQPIKLQFALSEVDPEISKCNFRF